MRLPKLFRRRSQDQDRIQQDDGGSLPVGSQNNPVHVSQKEHWVIVGASLGALFVSLITLTFSCSQDSSMGMVEPLEPSGYAIIRGVDMGKGIGIAPYDHLVMPMEWKNDSGHSVTIRNPTLVLHKLNAEGQKVSKVCYPLIGEYKSISHQSFSKPYEFKNSVIVEPHSVSQNALVFRRTAKPYLHSYSYRVTVEFERVPEDIREKPLLNLDEANPQCGLDGRDEERDDFKSVVLIDKLTMPETVDGMPIPEENEHTGEWTNVGDWSYWTL